ncbi:hypothetical protein CONLIGDRAFT_695511 [Coniochaeta ligniaria NRRL 30616]|uniref:Chitin-binding type-1 domain-containing protein n=1 Tax=Coniochaeta ligniaria NRRL 30616 TaxID=1408157 RepID=A0A1J7JT12_9PEZI|nr:hypothetical protein CONLIGDRAFT_695511 [Coniochaeta ligniaria NRRL 30616]
MFTCASHVQPEFEIREGEEISLKHNDAANFRRGPGLMYPSQCMFPVLTLKFVRLSRRRDLTAIFEVVVLLSCIARAIAQDLTSTNASPTSSALQVSNDGSCGAGLTCDGSLYGQCCSEHGFCGNGDAYCGAGCQAEFGACVGPASTTGSIVGSGPQTVTVTKTVSVFASGLFTTTTTITGAVTRTVLTTATNVVSRTEVRTVTQTATKTTTAAVLSTSIVLSVSSVYVTKTLTQVVLETSTLTTLGCAPTSLPSPPTTTASAPTTSAAAPSAPSPTLVGSPAACTKWYKTQSGETCTGVASKNGITLAQLMTWNPVGRIGRVPVCGNDPAAVVGLCRVNCEALWSGYYLCVGV